MRFCICAIMKNNFEYIKEWCEHYLSLGVSKIIIYDNNDISDKRKIKVPSSDVIVIDWRGIYSGQLPAYEDCYKKYSNEFDWFGFFDSDEYLIINKWNNVQEMISELGFADIIAINWVNYDDMGVIKRNMRIPVNKFFTRVAKYWNDFYHYKQFIKSGLEGFEIHQHNILLTNPTRLFKRVNVKGESIGIDDYITKKHCNECFIKHVLTKTLSEYINEKAFNGKPTGRNDRSEEESFGYFFDVNEKTPEKIKMVKDYINYRNKHLNVHFLMNPSYALLKRYSDGKFDIAITSNDKYKTFLNRPSRILIMSIQDASQKYPNMKIVN